MGAIAILKLFRFPLAFTAMADSAAGYLIARQGMGDPLVLLLLAVGSGGLYGFGMAMNDVADLERDRQIHPQRVLPSGRITLRGAWIASLAVLALSAAALVSVPSAPPTRLGLWGALAFLILVYNWFLKWPPVMGLVRAFNLLLGFSCGTATATAAAWGLAAAGTLFLYVTALTFVSTFEEEEGGGRKRGGLLAAGVLGMAVAVLGFPVMVPLGKGTVFRPEALGVAGILAGWILFRWIRIRKEGTAVLPLLVRDGVAGIILLDAAMVLSCGYTLPGLAVASLLVPAALGVWGVKKLA